MERDEFYNALYLAHHGIKGQKWGHRRFQNEDGSLTAEGKGRYDKEGINKSEKKNSGGFSLSDKQKKALKIGAAVAATALATYGAYKLSKHLKNKAGANIIEIGNRIADAGLKKSHFVRQQGFTGSGSYGMHTRLLYGAKANQMQGKTDAIRAQMGNKAARTMNSLPRSVASLIKNRKNVKDVRKGTDGYLDAIWEEVSSKKPTNNNSSSNGVDYNAAIMETLNKMRKMQRTGKKSK